MKSCLTGIFFGSMFGTYPSTRKCDSSLLSDTESTNLVLVRDQEVEGSNPFAPTTSFHFLLFFQTISRTSG
jgi:hypothetical protein